MDATRKAGRPYLLFFGAICVLFIGILVVTWRITRRATIVMLDEQGQVTTR
ncbi:hypothetical protein [Mesoterricola sediminis]|uniref:Uncharacterized protein n=1 Tax=Mesoterricola sediminis TaxID=2927980 RepID=A0AA48GTR8_9BACT|nr:hypothetical protein [Mesoterricola sediminis]BDU75505.1 hypothetical protein METESE_04630 [Mesoterricola sediminis]